MSSGSFCFLEKRIFWGIITYVFKTVVESNVLFNYGWTLFLITAKTGFSGTARLSTSYAIIMFCSKNDREQSMSQKCLIITSDIVRFFPTHYILVYFSLGFVLFRVAFKGTFRCVHQYFLVLCTVLVLPLIGENAFIVLLYLKVFGFRGDKLLIFQFSVL